MSSLNFMELCRLCLVKDRVQIPIFEGEGDIRQIFLKIASCLPVKVKKDDKLPKKICDDCMYKVEMLYQFWNTTANAEKQLLEWLGEAAEDKKTNLEAQNVKQESLEQDPCSELAKSLSRVEAVLAETREVESDNDHFASGKAETDSDDEPLSSLEPTTFVNVGLDGSGTNESRSQGEFLAPGAPSTSKTNNSTNAQTATTGEPIIKIEVLDEEYIPLQERPKKRKLKKSSRKAHHTTYKCEGCREKFQLSELKKVFTRDDLGETVKMLCASCISDIDDDDADIKIEPCDPLAETTNRKNSKRSESKSETRMLLEGLTEFKCELCSETFSVAAHLERHVTVHSVPKPYTCDVCKKKFKRLMSMLIHKRKHFGTLEFSCGVCNYSSAHKSSLELHMKRHSKDYKVKCETCDKGFFSTNELIDHYNIHTGARPYQCDMCEKSYPYKHNLTAHKKSQHPSGPVEKKLHQCETCGKVFSFKKSLTLHMKSHTGENVYICDICGKSLTNKEHLMFHRRIHTGEKPSICDVCGKGFAKPGNLTLHKRVHSGEKPYACEMCGKCFSQRSTLVIHRRYHTGQRPYVCELCKKSFVCQALLTTHSRTHKTAIYEEKKFDLNMV